MPPPDFDACARHLLTPQGLADPFPLYHQLRALAPVGWSSLFDGAWLVTGYGAVAEALRDEVRLSMEQGLAPKVEPHAGRGEEYKAFVSFVSHSMLVQDGRDHRRLRSIVARAFTPRAAQEEMPLVERIAEELVAPLVDRPDFDLATELAHPLPTRVIAELFGLPREDTDQLRAWASDLTVFLGGGPDPAETIDAALVSTLAITRYFEEQLARRRRRPSDDLISDLLAYEEGGDRLRDKEILAQCLLLFTAGHQTTADLLSGAAWQLLGDPALLAQLRAQPDLLAAALEEVLRYDGPVQMAGRLAVAPRELAGTPIEAGQRVILVLGAANRDPERFPEPDRFLLPRPDNPHLAFGAGPHQCLGAALARTEARVALEVLLRRLPGKLAVAPPVRDLNVAFRRITSLPVCST